MEGIREDSSILKRKRSKRQRPHLSSADLSPSSNSAQFSGKPTEVEEDMADCLMLLSKGGPKPESNNAEETTNSTKSTSRQFAEAATTTCGKAGTIIFICNTCGKCFASFQALGGHRASHKRQKLSASSPLADEAKTAVKGEDSIQLSMNSLSPQVAAKARLHKCSICGVEFNSGQALGGHMRRHRTASRREPEKKERKSSGFLLDLNLPAPCDDDEDLVKPSSSVSETKTPALSLERNAQILTLTSSLVNFHY